MGSIAISSPFQSLSGALLNQNLGVPSLAGSPLVSWKYTGNVFDFDATQGNTGNAVVPTLGTVPTDAVGVEMWVNGNAADDYLFCTPLNSGLASTGVFATNITANLLNVRWVASGQKLLMPFQIIGTEISTMRVATGKTSARVQGRFVSRAAGLPYLLASTTSDLLTGANGQQQLTYGSSTKYPTGYSAVMLQVVGPGPVRVYTDGTAVSSTTGDLVGPGTYLIDFARHGISITALKIYLPTGTNIVAHSLVDA